ncbi:nucleotidyl transferase AbiEii/AbiGii toxin family protein [Lysinibacillus sp. NPDC097195]|uniref:nucleotidyl transferase AbiEii/AbiGii toxin family protein n=1 Tax=Lysinibacillus sp. NPDC097195 TaxID=3364141 RepID=UPI00382C2560
MKHVQTRPISVLDQLTDVAKKQQVSLDVLVTSYAQERLLVRLAASSYEDQYLLYGDFLVGLLAKDIAKSTARMTLCAKKMANKDSIIKHAFQEISTAKVAEDGIHFMSEEIELSSSDEEVYIRIPAQIASITTYIEITICLFNTIPMSPKKIVLPTYLGNATMEQLAYPIELIIAHKFNTIYQYPALEQSINDYYDIYLLATTQNFEGRVLQEAIFDTFDRQKTTIEKYPVMFSKKGGQLLTDVPFDKVQEVVQRLLKPIFAELVVEGEFFKNWDYKLCDWR